MRNGVRQRPRPIATAIAAAALLASPALPSASPASHRGCVGADAEPREASLETFRSATLCLINGERARRGRSKLRVNGKLRRAALRHSYDMRRRGYFAHRRSGGPRLSARIRRTGYINPMRRWRVAENIGWGSGSAGTPRQLVRAWMKSSGHRRTILDRGLRHIGLGIVWGAPTRKASSSTRRHSAIYTTDFGVIG